MCGLQTQSDSLGGEVEQKQPVSRLRRAPCASRASVRDGTHTPAANVNHNDVDLPPTDEPIEYDKATLRAVKGIPSAEDLATRGDFVLVRRVGGRIEQVPLLDWHWHQLERHKAMRPDDSEWSSLQDARFKAIVEDRMSL